MTWEGQYQLWLFVLGAHGAYADGERWKVCTETRRAMRGGGPLDTDEGWRWLYAAPSDRDRRRFLFMVCRGQQISKRLAYLMVRAGVLERDPSFNRGGIDPAVKVLGAERVCEVLMDHLRDGTDAEKAGAASACYWVRGGEAYIASPIRAALRDAMLREFVRNPDLDVRRRVLPLLPLAWDGWHPDVQPLVGQAVEIARAHPDEYIRHRVEIQLGSGGPFKPIPA